MGGIEPNDCRRCLGDGRTSFQGETALCPACLGTGARRPRIGDAIVIDGEIVGFIDEADGALRAVAAGAHRLPPQQWEIAQAHAEDVPERDDG